MRIVLLLVVILLFLIIFSNKTIPTYLKTIFSILLVMIFAFGYLYEMNMENSEAVRIKRLEYFQQGKELLCRGKIIVNNKTFSYLSGTMTFSPLFGNIKDKGLIISINNCRIKK